MRENRTYGSEGGEVVIGLSYPYQNGDNFSNFNPQRSWQGLDSRLRRE